MSFWFLPPMLTDAKEGSCLTDSRIMLAANGLPDLSRAQSADQLAEWLRRLHLKQPPEYIQAQAQHYWRLKQELDSDDYIVVASGEEPPRFWLGEITGVYRYMTEGPYSYHAWPVQWIKKELPPEFIRELKPAMSDKVISPITDTALLDRLKQAIPSLRKRGHTVFKWVALATLIGEFFYFWPR